MNRKLLEELGEQKQTNNEMKKALNRIEEKLFAMEKPQQVQSGNQQRPTTTTKTTLKPTPSPENCKLKISNVCHFAVIFAEDDVNYNKAVNICKKRNADVGLTQDEESYNAVMNYLRSNIPKGRSWIDIWTGIYFDPKTDDVTPADSFINWYPTAPLHGMGSTTVYLNVDSKPSKCWQGMVNASPTLNLNGVICEILI
uniref:uncharacterized protein LOC120345563 n=1 Tax=Styela clava TaxID=7725 RepID=UPI00193A79FA|nr:uncharacterized protein LOC120345563 [Styela clava]